MAQAPSTQNFADYLTVSQAAEFLGVSSWTLRNWDRAGKFKPLRHPKNGYRIYRHEDLESVLKLRQGVATDSPSLSQVGESEHFVQFYENDQFLIDSIAEFIAAGLAAGEVTIIIATEPHRAGVEKQLIQKGFDLESARSRGQYRALDAADCLRSFMVDGSPDLDRFNQVISESIRQIRSTGTKLRAFGEMVALLWSAGNRQAAIRLEELWCELSKADSFALMCAYPINAFGSASDDTPFSDICTCHSRVFPAESYAALSDPERRLRAITRLQQKAQSLEAEIAHRQEVEKALSTAEQRMRDLLESERAARAEIERISRLKDEFLATLSHELRTPLNAIYGWTQIIRQSAQNPQTVAEGIAVIDRNVRAQTKLIEDLLDMSRIVSGKIRLDVQHVELIPVIHAAVESVRPSAEAKQIHITHVLDPLAGPVSGDPHRLQQIIWNLLTNAVKFTPKGGKIELLLERVNSHLEITVSDTGQGISPEFLPQVFERFHQADSSTTRKHGGLGLGLSIVKQLVELHGGSVRVKSPGEGQGASFTVALPLLISRQLNSDREHPTSSPATALDCSVVELGGVTVMVVDDEPDARQLIARLLGDCGAQVIDAASVDEAIARLHTHTPHVLVSDIGMPGRDGYELIRRIRSLYPAEVSKIPAIALTAFARSEDRTRAMLAGYQIHISKPVEPQELVVAVASLAGRAGR